MTMQVHQDNDLQLAAGLGALYSGLGILGPFGANPAQKVDAGTYEITGTQVALRDQPGGTEKGRFNNAYGSNNNLVVPPPDQVDFDGQTGTAQGLTWASVTVKSGTLQGQKGYVAIEYMAPVGWTASHNGTGPAQGGGGGGGILPASPPPTITTTETDYTPWILGGAAVVGVGFIAWALLAKPKRGGVRRMGRRRSSTRRHRR
jgi:hypothetical protein